MHHFEGKRILVTGGSSGIGRATARLLASRRARICLVARNEGRLLETLGSLEGEGHRWYRFDLSDSDEIPRFLKMAAEEGGRFHGLFHAAGEELILPLPVLKAKTVTDRLSATVGSALMLAKGFSQKSVYVDSRQSSLVFMSSAAAVRGQSGMAVYSAIKAAIDGAMRSLAVELAPKNIRVNSITAAAIKTEMHERLVANAPEESIRAYEKKHLLGFGEPIDVAEACAFLLSEAAKWITGTSLTVDGGYTCF